jgi:hypothetical protein
MSELFFERMDRELAPLLASLTPPEREEVDREVERITGKDCDDAARSLSKEEFREVAGAAIRNIRQRARRRQGPADEDRGEPIPAYA